MILYTRARVDFYIGATMWVICCDMWLVQLKTRVTRDTACHHSQHSVNSTSRYVSWHGINCNVLTWHQCRKLFNTNSLLITTWQMSPDDVCLEMLLSSCSLLSQVFRLLLILITLVPNIPGQDDNVQKPTRFYTTTTIILTVIILYINYHQVLHWRCPL